MREFDWEDGFTPYWATLDGVTLTEYADGVAQRVAVLVRCEEWDGHANAADYAMTEEFSSGEVDSDAAVWIDGQGYALVPTMSDLAAALRIVIADQREADWADGMTDADIVAGVRETLIIPGRPHVPGGVHVEGDSESDNVRAYVAVLAASAEDIAAALTR
ncbi:hypothetical protein SOM10_11885 [Microbacterium sp. CFBP9023]|uniref:hypothetical protein n=1 Tax=Microbacterium sp. CFBP9023 TaxID=3096535 RepID=UPI002A6A2150|nr:hypothetical protein [Microbacterium sp. CFBP9023]MDY0984596.1 hypothetical protein [Microbacterium sp. CFBP9023]